MGNIPKYFSRKLRPKEEPVMLVRPFILAYFWWWFLSFCLFFGALYFMFFLFDFGFAGKIIFWFVFLLGLFSLVKTLIICRFSGVLITKDRIIDFDQNGFFHRQISEALFSKIQDISMEQKGFWQTVLKYGTIKIQTAGSDNVLEIQNIFHPQKIHNILVDIQAQVLSVQEEYNYEDILKDDDIKYLLKILFNKKRKMGEKKFRELIRDLFDK